MSGAEAKTADAVIREVADGDMATITAIYAHHVLSGLASFEEEPPDAAEMMRRRDKILDQELPYIVAVSGGTVGGYAYASPFRPRPAYRHSVEDSVYVTPDMARRGIGRLLLETLIERCAAQGYRQMIAVIGDSENAPSINLHAKLGFRMAGTIRSVGFKFGRWVDSVYMQRPLGDGDTTLPDR